MLAEVLTGKDYETIAQSPREILESAEEACEYGMDR